MKKAITALLLGAVITVEAQAQSADQPYPNRPIKLLVGYTPAGGADTVARIVGDALGRELGQPVVIENRPGAQSTLASALLASSAPDGYTLALGTANLFGVDQHLFKAKYKPTDFTPIANLTTAPLLLVVNPNLGIKSVGDLKKLSQASATPLNYATSGVGGSPHVAALMFSKEVGKDMTHVPFKGGAPAMQALIGGEVQFSFATAPSALPMAKAGRLVALGVTSANPSPVAPGIPTLKSQGLSFDYQYWMGLVGPANMPKDIVDKIYTATAKVLKDESVKRKLLETGSETMTFESPEHYAQALKAQGKRALDRLIAANVTLD